ncbi:MAG: Hint domain-containing protein [Rhodomicrobium sp.]
MEDKAFKADPIEGKASLITSRRSFLRGSKIVVSAGLAAGLALITRSTPAFAPLQKCFLPQTRIATPDGEVKVEELRIGESVLTASGDIGPVKWIGRQQFERASNPGAAPIKISRFAIDGKAPHADLYVSPGHAIYIGGVLIPARYLVNGITIVADAKPEMLTITYYHVELDTHEAILAEGLAVESSLGDDRSSFDNADEFVRLYGSIGQLTPFAPIAYKGGRTELASHIRSALAPIYDFRKPADKIRDRIAGRAKLARAA